MAQHAPAWSVAARYAALVELSVPDTIATAEKPALSDKDRGERLALLAERLRSTDGLDHDTLAQIEQLTGPEH